MRRQTQRKSTNATIKFKRSVQNEATAQEPDRLSLQLVARPAEARCLRHSKSKAETIRILK